jgi:hypothetical protein
MPLPDMRPGRERTAGAIGCRACRHVLSAGESRFERVTRRFQMLRP